eukprot:Ihof_evm10s115 gene=Ihof_evmTU10s115
MTVEDLDGLTTEDNSEYVCHANDVIDMRLVFSPEDVLSEEAGFPPEFTHQFFGDNEKIFGYKGLKIKICFSATQLIPYLEIDYDEKISNNAGAAPDDVAEKLTENFGQDFFMRNKDQYFTHLQNDADFQPMGELIHEFSCKGDDDEEESQYAIYKSSIDTAGLAAYHMRVQVLAFTFIDAASLIDLSDPRWNFFYVWKKEKEGGKLLYDFAGYCTTYNFFAYPDSLRTRISQFLVLPPYQQRGIGRSLLSKVYEDCIARPEVVEMTVEDPSNTFQYLRDTIDFKNCLDQSFEAPIPFGPITPEFITKVQKKLKLSKLQIRRVYEMLGLKGVDRKDKDAYKAYRLLVKKRLYTNYQDDLEQLKGDKGELHKFLADRYNELE